MQDLSILTSHPKELPNNNNIACILMDRIRKEVLRKHSL